MNTPTIKSVHRACAPCAPDASSIAQSATEDHHIILFRGHPVQFCPAARWPTFNVGIPRSEATRFRSVQSAREEILKYPGLTRDLDQVTIEPF